MIITEILCKQSGIAERVSENHREIDFYYSNSWDNYSHYSNSFQKQKPIRFLEKRLICFLEPLARIYIVLKQENNLPILPILHPEQCSMLNAQCLIVCPWV